MPDDKSTREPAPAPTRSAEPSDAAPASADAPATGDGPARADAPPATDLPATGDTPPPTDAPATRGAPDGANRRRRALILAAGGLAAIAALIAIVIATRHHAGGTAEPIAHPTGSAAIRAPEGPHLPGAPITGVRLTGFVVDGAGLPVTGAQVSAELERGAADRALAPPPRASNPGSAGADAGGVPDLVQRAIRNAGAGSSAGPGAGSGSAAPGDAGVAAPAVMVAAPTGADGRFVVEGLTPGRFRIRVTGPGLLPAEVRYVPVPSDEARIVVARQVAIEGTVSDGGTPVANAQVGLRGDAIGGTIELKAGPTGGFKFPNLPEGRYQLYAWQGALAARTVRVARLGAGPFGPVELRLEAASIVVGRVIDREEGTGLVAAVELRPSGDDQAPRYARSGDDGVFRIEGVPNGKWIADAFVPGYQSPGGVELEAGHGVPEIALMRGGVIEGRVLDSDGHPVAGATVRALTGGQNPTEVSAEVDRDKLRRFSGRTTAPVPVTPGVQGDDPQLIARGELGVLVGPIPPVPAPGVQVAQVAQVTTAVDPSLAGDPPALAGDAARGAIWTTGADGVYRIRGLGRARVTVLAAASGFAEARSRPITIAAGELIPGVDLILTPGTMIVGKVTDQHGTPVVGAQVTATPGGTEEPGAGSAAVVTQGAAIDVFTDESGDYKLGPVTGTVELHASAYGHGEAHRTIELAPVAGKVPGERHEDLLLVVADARIAGILEDATGAPVGGAHLDVVGGAGDGRHAIAAADGTFAIDQLPAGHLRLHIDHPAYPPDDVDIVAAADHQATARLRLPLGGGIEGVLLDAASGAPIPSVSLTASGPANGLAETSTDQAGRWKLGPLRPGRWKLQLKQPGYLPQLRELDVPVAHAPGQTSVRDIRLELARGALVGGTVRDARGQRLAAAHVIATAIGGTRATGASAGATCEADTDGQGEFRIHDCPTGDLEVAATKADLRGATRTTVRPGDEILSLSLELR